MRHSLRILEKKKRQKFRNGEAFDPKLISSIKWLGLLCHFFDGALETFEVTGNLFLLGETCIQVIIFSKCI